MSGIAIIGAAGSGMAMAAHLGLAGESVRLWNRSPERLDTIRFARGIFARGAVSGTFMPEVLTGDIAEAVDGARLVLVTVPAHAHDDVAAALAPHLTAGQIVVLNPGRTCGAMLVARALPAGVTVAETQTIVYTCRPAEPAAVDVLALKQHVRIAATDPDRTAAVARALPECLRPRFVPAGSWLETSLGNVGMILHPPVVLSNVGRIAAGGRGLHYAQDITRGLAGKLEALDAERLAVAGACGVNVPSAADWLRECYGVTGENLYECLQANPSYATIKSPRTLRHRYLLEDVSTGLVPLEAIGKAMHVATPLTSECLDRASRAVDTDFRAVGRNASVLGIDATASTAEVVAALQARA